MQEYTVTLSIDVSAHNRGDAVQEFIKLIDGDLLGWVYDVVDVESGEESSIDTEGW